MPLYSITGPDGRDYEIEGPEGATREQIIRAVQSRMRQQEVAARFAPQAVEAPMLPPEEPKSSTFGSELKRGFQQVGSSLRTTGESIFDSPEAAAQRGLERGKAISEEAGEGPSWERIKRVYEQQGLLGAAGQVASDIPKALAGQAANLAGMAGSAKLGAMAGTAVAPGAGTVVGGALGAGAYLLPQFFGSNVERQAAEDIEQGRPVDIETGKALGAATLQAGTEAAGTAFILGKRLVSAILGTDVTKAAASKAAQAALTKKAEQSLTRALAGGAAKGLVEIPVEISQQIIERAQAGMDVLSDEALTEYGNAAYQAGLIGPTLGSVGGYSERGGAKQQVEKQQEEAARVAAAQQAEAEAKRKASPEYLADIEQRYNAARAEIEALPALKKPKLPKNATPEQELAHEDALAAYEEQQAKYKALREQYDPLRAEYKEALPRIKAEAARVQAIEIDAARTQPTAGKVETFIDGERPQPTGDEASVLAAERDRRMYGPESQQAMFEGVFAQADQRDNLDARDEDPAALRNRLTRDIRGIDEQLNILREQAQVAPAAELPTIAQRFKALQTAQQQANAQLEQLGEPEAGPPGRAVVERRVKNLEKQLQNARDSGDVMAAARIAQQLQDTSQTTWQGEFAGKDLRDAGGVSESVDSFNQRVVGPEIGAERERRAAVEAERQAAVGPEAEALQRIGQRQDATPYIQQARQELGTKREIETMEQQAAMDRARTRQPDLFAEGPPQEVRTPSRVTPEALTRLIARAETSPNLTPQDSLLLEDVKDAMPAMLAAPTPSAAALEKWQAQKPATDDRAALLAWQQRAPNISRIDTVADWLYRAAVGNPSPERRAEVTQILQQLEQGKRSETDRQTEAGYRAMSKDEKRAMQGLTPGTKPGPVTSMTNRRGVMERAPTGPEMRAAQQELPGVEPTASAFRDFREFENYLASTGLAQMRDAMGLEGDTVARQTRNLEGLERTVAGVRKQIADVVQKRDALRSAGQAEQATAATLLRESEAKLLELQRELDAEMIGAQVRYLEAAMKAAEAQQVSANIAQQVSDNVALLEQQISAYESQAVARGSKMTALRAAQVRFKTLIDAQASDKQLMATSLDSIAQGLPFDVHNRAFFDARLRVINRKADLVDAHQKMMQANAAVPGMPTLSSTVFRDFLITDTELQAQHAAAQRRLGGFAAAKNKAKAALDESFRAQQARPEVIKALGDARSDVEVAAQLLNAATQNTQATVAPFEQELQRLGAIAEPMIRRIAEIQRNMPKAAEVRRQQAETAKEVGLRERRKARAEQLRAEREKKERIVAGDIVTPEAARVRVGGAEQPLTPREKVSFPAVEQRFKSLDRILSRLSWKDPKTEVALRQWVAKHDRLQGEFDKRTAELIEEQIQRVEDYAKFKEQFPNQKANHAKREKVIQNQAQALGKRLDWVVSKASGTSEARPAGTPVVRQPIASRAERQAASERLTQETRSAPRTPLQQKQLDAALARVRTVLASSKPQGEKDTLIDAVFERFPELPLTREQVLELAQYIPGRAIGPATRKQTSAPNTLRSGASTETRAAVNITPSGERAVVEGTGAAPNAQSRNPIREARGIQQRDTTISEKEMQEANRLAEEMRKKTDAEKAAEVEDARKTAEELTKKSKEKKPKKAKTRAERALDEAALYEDADSDAALANVSVDTDIDPDTISIGQDAFDDMFDADGGAGYFSEVRDGDVYEVREEAPLDSVAAEAALDGRLLDVLARLETNGSSPFVKELAKRLRPLVMRTKLRIAADGISDGKGGYLEGDFDPETNTVRIDRVSLNEDTLLHEVVHAVTLNTLNADPKTLTAEQRQARAELENLFQNAKNDPSFSKEYAKKNIAEFVSELMSNAAVRNKVDALQPTLLERIYDAILRMLGVSPSQTRSERAVENAYKLFAPSRMAKGARVASVMRGVFPGSGPRYSSVVPADLQETIRPTPAKQTTSQKVSAAALGFRTLALDRWAPMEALVKLGLAKGKIDEARATQMRIHMRLHEDTNRFAVQALTNGVPQLQEVGGKRYYGGDVSDTNIRTVVQQVSEAGVGNNEAALGMWQAWMEGNRVISNNLGFDVLNPEKPQDAEQAFRKVDAFVKANPKVSAAFEKARATYRQYNKELLQQSVEAGTISKEEAARLSTGDYIPFYRIENDLVKMYGVASRPITIGSVIDQPYLKELVGDDQSRMTALAGIVQNTSLLTKMNIRNLQAKDAANVLKDLGLGKIFPVDKGGTAPAGVIKFKSNGLPYWIKLEGDAFPEGVTPEMLLSGMQGIKTTIPTVIKAMAVPTRLLRNSITRMPLYVVRQMIRDPLFAWLTTGGKFTPVVSSIKELTKIRRGLSPTEETLARSGAISSNVMTGDYQDMARALSDLGTTTKGWNWAMAGLDNLAMQADASTRAVLYDSFRKQGMDHVDALLGAAESMNFSRRGTSSSLYALSAIIPFFNAQLQGIDALYRTFRGDTVLEKKLDVRNKLYQRGALMLATTFAYAAMMQDDEAYKNATPQERALNWFVRLPGVDEAVRIPIPFEPGLIFKAIPETIFNTMFGDTTAKEAVRQIGAQVVASTPGILPSAAKPLIELATNYSFYTDRPLESGRDLAVDKEFRYRESTTELAKLLGQTGVLSPIQIEHLVRGYFSSAGILLMSMANYPLRPFVSEGAPELPEKLLSQMPVFGAGFQPNDGRGVIDAAYKDVERFQRAHQTFNRLIAQGNRAEAMNYASKFAREITLASTGGAFTQQMGEFADMRRQVAASGMDPAQKREMIDQIRKAEIAYSAQIRAIAKQTSE